MHTSLHGALLGAAALLLSACGTEPRQALGTLEYDRISLPAPVSERIVAVVVDEGGMVEAGQLLLQLDDAQARATLTSAQAQARRMLDMLAELEHGPRGEAIEQAGAQLDAAMARADEARAFHQRLLPLQAKQMVSAAMLDQARSAADSADATARAARAALDELLHGTRDEQLAQAHAALQSAQAQVDVQQVLLDKLSVTAPRRGRIDSLPYRRGDQPPAGAPVVILLVGDAPHARIYIPQPQRAAVGVGDSVRVHVASRTPALSGTVRMVRSEPVFTPYYALVGDDVAHLSYLAEITLGDDAAQLPAGLPVRVEFTGQPR